MSDPSEHLYDVDSAVDVPGGLILAHYLSGFVDAGRAAGLAVKTLLEQYEPVEVARFDLDTLLDYRGRRPVMHYDTDHWAGYEEPGTTLSLLRDQEGARLLLLHGLEPDYRWEAVVRAVQSLIERLGVRLTVGLSAIPMGVPHTRPAGVIVHGTRAELVRGRRAWVGEVDVPGHFGGLLEWRLGQAGHDAMAFAVNVPHYVSQSEYPEAAAVLLEHLSHAAGVPLDVGELREAAADTRTEIDAEVAKSAEVVAVVRALEEQYDTATTPGAADLGDDLPSGDELGAELERFLADPEGRGGG